MPVLVLAGVLLQFAVSSAFAGGGGVMQTDRCVVSMGFMDAHLTIYQPRTQASEKFCDSVPGLTETIFVLDYLHDSLNQVPIEFRIIENATGLGRFAEWRDVEALGDLAPLTVFHREPVIRPGGSLEVEHTFEKPGNYLILIRTRHPTKDIAYRALAPLEVGGTDWALWLGVPAAGLMLGAGGWWLRRVARRNAAAE